MAHKLEEPYSGKNPVPQIATKLTSLVTPERATKAKAAQLQDKSSRQDEKRTEKRASRLAKGYIMHVVDPVTGEELDIKNADEDPDSKNKGQNVLETEYPPPDWGEHRRRVVSEVIPCIAAIVGAYTLTFVLTHLLSNSWITTSLSLVLPSVVAYTVVFRVQRLSRLDFDDCVWHAERMRGLRAGSDEDGDGQINAEERTKESAEWANAILRGVWPILNPDLFGIMIDLLEDIMQTSVPKFIDSVRVADLGFGSNAARITSIRSLPDSQPREQVNKEDQPDQSPEEQNDLNEQHVNVEIGFAYRGLPTGHSAKSKAKNLHVKTTMVSLMGLPRVTISVVALSRALPNVMNLPYISGFISSSINTAVAEYVAPKSFTVDLQRLISGDDIKKDTDAVGVLVVHIHSAKDVRAMDADGGSDPYVTMTFSRLGKPLYSTRIIKGDRNPIFEETAVALVDMNTIRLREKLSFQLWDSDRMSVDDLLGIAEADILDLICQPGTPHRRITRLSDPHTAHTPGTLEYTVGYYAKRPPTAALRSSGQDPGVPPDLRDNPEFQNAREVALDDLEAAVLVTPPDPAWPSGIVSVQVHEIRGLGVKREGRERSVVKMHGSREGQKGQDEAGEVEEADGLPSSYCTISLNDELVYQTRVKPITSTPIFNAGTERFIKDWRTGHIAVTVKDSRMREKDAILGVVMIKLSKILVNGSQHTRVYSLEEGLGYGRIRISVLFRPVEATLPQNLLGFDTGLLEIRDLCVKLTSDLPLDLSKCEARLKTTKSDAEEKVSRKNAHTQGDGGVHWSPDAATLTRVPVRTRYGCALLMSFKDTTVRASKRAGRKALAVLWLRDVADNEEGAREVPLWNAADGDYSRLKMNYSPPDGNLDAWDADRERVRRVGTVRVHLVFRPGISELHRDLLNGGGSGRKEAWEAYQREVDGGLRGEVGEVGGEERDPGRRPEGKRRGSDEKNAEDNTGTPPAQDAERHESGHRNGSSQPPPSCQADDETPNVNTVVSSEAVEDGNDVDHDDCTQCTSDGSFDTGDEKKGPLKKFQEWRRHEKELHRQHRGIMQAKPARTVEWVKDSMEDGIHHIKDRFSMKTMKPGVETEV
ncbi:hypothetical protein PHLGIDRAFT_30925 [Phlebiopsis gigantea 11061_1 CR5-6]|uniref:C2 domain-containing protein n=1 Tax=Phlebiopsis gigantea (strain 11061_1 CR5-6) TaxID=745531 RepID=A0A0C3PHT2_PHLG1|nr:hypothetical protein PHLGIDRAFT_30925 [Phlebiopsis gigantea 11061_1 CR5-6]